MILSNLRQAITDGLVVSAIGAGLALVANHWSPRGISLHRDYFPEAAAARPAPPPDLSAGPAASGAKPAAPGGTIAAAPGARFVRRGLAFVDHARAVELFRDPRFADGRVVFVDARDDRHYHAGHIPNAVQLDHYRIEHHVSTVLAVCLRAEQIVVYCSGGTCEDSELAALDLIEFGLPASKIVVYGGGIDEWRRHGLPIETGARGSGTRPPP